MFGIIKALISGFKEGWKNGTQQKRPTPTNLNIVATPSPHILASTGLNGKLPQPSTTSRTKELASSADTAGHEAILSVAEFDISDWTANNKHKGITANKRLNKNRIDESRKRIIRLDRKHRIHYAIWNIMHTMKATYLHYHNLSLKDSYYDIMYIDKELKELDKIRRDERMAQLSSAEFSHAMEASVRYIKSKLRYSMCDEIRDYISASFEKTEDAITMSDIDAVAHVNKLIEDEITSIIQSPTHILKEKYYDSKPDRLDEESLALIFSNMEKDWVRTLASYKRAHARKNRVNYFIGEIDKYKDTPRIARFPNIVKQLESIQNWLLSEDH